ncbi:MAG: type IV secretory system conjugative DNA transfer family protein [Lachnospiraceae bacterium]|nr:type IV secretory system conjugative DNA transfer family protein [Lachnospiraceae bacterium]
MKEDTLILAQDQYYSLDCYETRLNNNVLVVGTSGAGKTRGVVEPNLMQASGSYVVSDPKGNLYAKYKDYLKERGYRVVKLDFTDPANSEHYNFFDYIHSTQDIVKVAHMLIYLNNKGGHYDPFWDESSQLLMQACIAFLMESDYKSERTLEYIMKLIDMCDVDEYSRSSDPSSELDKIMRFHEEKHPGSYAAKTYRKFRTGANKTLKNIMICVTSRLGLFDSPEINELLRTDTVNIPSIGDRKTALFVVVSDTDRSLDVLANIFFSQAMNELCLHADKECEGNRLPVPVRFILDDFATNVKICEFPRMIASIRSRGISAMLMIQAESQLQEAYGYDASTIIGNCDTYLYMGGNDVGTAKAVAERCDMPLKKILNMPVGTNWIFRRGQAPINGRNIDLDAFTREVDEDSGWIFR